jgi:hypothetical protein
MNSEEATIHCREVVQIKLKVSMHVCSNFISVYNDYQIYISNVCLMVVNWLWPAKSKPVQPVRTQERRTEGREARMGSFCALTRDDDVCVWPDLLESR